MKLYEVAGKQLDMFNDEHIGEMLLKNCRPFLELINYNISDFRLYRGLSHADDLFLLKNARLNDRSPLTIKRDMHNELNQVFTEQFGHPYRNGVFVTSDTSVSDTYGSTYSIFPVGKFEFLWSPSIGDLFVDIQKEDGFNKIKEGKAGYQTTDIIAAIYSTNEIMLWTDKYYALNMNLLSYGFSQDYKKIQSYLMDNK